MNHKYSTIALLLLISILFIVFIITGLDIGDYDYECQQNDYIIKNNNKWECSTINHAEGFYHSYDTPITIDIIDINAYVNITGFVIDNLQGFIFNNNYSVEVTHTGLYDVFSELSFEGGNNGEYEIELFRNEDSQEDCAFFRGTSTITKDIGAFRCLKNLNDGDILTVRVKDVSDPPQDINIYQLNFIIIEVY